MTQCERILDYMKECGSITPLEALRDLGVMRLAARIADLKRAGWQIEKDMANSLNRFGQKIQFARYRLAEEGQMDLFKETA